MNNPLVTALELIFSGDKEVFFIAFTSMRISLTAVLIASLISIPLGVFITFKNFRTKKVIVAALSSLMALPTVLIGLFIYSFLRRNGALGRFDLLFTPGAVVIGQVILATPLITSMVHTGLNKLDVRFKETLITLGAGIWDILWATMWEAKYVILSSVLAGFGRVIGEVGISMILGGNIRWFTRTITTTIAMENSKGNFELALALGLILMFLAITVNFLLHLMIRQER